jgi:outer membrane protein
MRRVFVTAAFLCAFVANSIAQEKWDLRRCVDYALANNISIKQNEVQERVGELTYIQSKDSRWPTANFGLAYGLQNGRSIDPTTNQFISQQVGVVNPQLQSGVTLFNFFSIKNTIEANRLGFEATKQQTNRLRNDIALNVAAAFLQALLSFEQANIAKVQVEQTIEQLNATRKRVDAGALPELNAQMLESQLATDSATLISGQNQYQLNLLALKNLLNMDAATYFDIASPPVDKIPVVPLSELEPELVYSIAVQTQPLQKENELRLKSAIKTTAATKAQMYPSIGGFVNLNSSFSSAQKTIFEGTPTVSFEPSGLYVPINGTNVDVYAPNPKYPNQLNANLLRQFDRNFRQSFGINLNVPIFNGGQFRTNYRKAQLNERTISLQMVADSQALKQNIYQAYENALTALQSFNSRTKAIDAAQRSYDLGVKRYENGLLPTLDLTILQNNLTRAKIDAVSSHYDYIFRLKILEFYKGQGLKL